MTILFQSKTKWLLLLAVAFGTKAALSQPGADMMHSDKMQGFNYMVRASAIAVIGGGTHLSASMGLWVYTYDLQPSINTSFNWMLGYNNFGGRIARNQKTMASIIFSPMVLVRCGPGQGRVAEVNPFYFGYSSGILNSYKNYAALGTSFVAAPKSLNKNIMTSRNRSQQLLYLGGRKGWKDGYIMANLIEDYFALTNNLLQALADNRDRFFTGAGNLQVNIQNLWTLKYYSETYTGCSYVDHFQYPDLVNPYDTVGNGRGIPRLFSGPSRRKRYTYQDPGQQEYNQGRDVLVVDFAGKAFGFDQQRDWWLSHTGKASLVLGLQGHPGNMWLQNWIHNAIKLDKYTYMTGEKAVDRYHRFESRRGHLSSGDWQGKGKKEYRDHVIFGLGYGYGIQ